MNRLYSLNQFSLYKLLFFKNQSRRIIQGNLALQIAHVKKATQNTRSCWIYVFLAGSMKLLALYKRRNYLSTSDTLRQPNRSSLN